MLKIDLKSQEFRLKVQDGVKSQLSFSDLLEMLREYRDIGGTQKNALDILENLRYEMNDAQEDILLELLDIASGFCIPSMRIW